MRADMIAAMQPEINGSNQDGVVALSGAKATALQTLPRLPNDLEPRKASGLRRVHRRFPHDAGLID